MKVFIRAKRVIAIAWTFTAAFLLASCGSDEIKPAAPGCVFPDDPSIPAPSWICNEQVDDIAVSAVGAAVKTTAGHSFMKNMATTDARVQLTQAMKTHVQNMIKQYAESTSAADAQIVDEVNASVTKQITEETLGGSKTLKTLTGPNGALYLLLGIDSAAVATVTEHALNASMNKDRVLWQQFRAQQGQEELASSIANMKLH